MFLPRRRFVFGAANAHYVPHDGFSFNRFFDPWISQAGISHQSAIFLYDGAAPLNRFNRKSIQSYVRARNGFLYARRIFGSKVSAEMGGYEAFASFLESHDLTRDFARTFSRNAVADMAPIGLVDRVRFFKAVWQKMQPEKVSILCYYGSLDAYAMIAAANQLNIPTCELQHGPMTDIHLCYGNWNNLPEGGFDVLPRTFWCWDDETAQLMDRWIARHPLYRALVTGNPWVQYWLGRQQTYPDKGFVLYTLQTDPLTIAMLFPPVLVDIIKNDGRMWYIRLHPRQMAQSDAIKKHLRDCGILDKVDMDRGTSDALPLLLSNASLHLTHFSGSVIEASQIGTPTVLLHPTALSSFPELIARGAAWYLDINRPDFKEEFLYLLRQPSHQKVVLPSRVVNPFLRDELP